MYSRIDICTTHAATSYLLYTAFLLTCLHYSQQLVVPPLGNFYDGNATVSVLLSPVNICNTSVPMCLETSAPLPICLTKSSALVPKSLCSELSRI